MTITSRVAILGATSQIARDLIISFSAMADFRLNLFARKPEIVEAWLARTGLSGRYSVSQFSEFHKGQFDAVINFVGIGDPARLAALGAEIFDITLEFDEMVLRYLGSNPECRYLFLSSGAVYGSDFDKPVDGNSKAVIAINHLQSQDWYGVAKLHAECRHRAYPELSIVDIRVFNYFSRSQDINARFLITDILRAIRDGSVLKTSPDYIVRDFLHPSDFFRLVHALLSSPPANAVVDCYSKAPITKPALLHAMQEKFGLRYDVAPADAIVNATGLKSHYYSLNLRAADFGYKPAMTALDGVLQESEMMLEGLVECARNLIKNQ